MGRSAAAAIIIIFTFSVLACLDPVGYPENTPKDTGQSTGDDTIPITIDGIQPEAGKQAIDRINTIVQGVGADFEWKDHTGTIINTTPLTFEEFEDYTALIYLYAKGGHTLPLTNAKIDVKGALDFSYNPATAVITAVFPRTHYPVASVTELNTAVAAVQLLPSPADPRSETVIDLTDAFYDDANNPSGTNSGGFITVGAGAADNNIPYTIRGLGRYHAKELNVGVLLANNNVTLENLRIDITSKDKGVPHLWSRNSKTNPAEYLYYRAAVIIGRYKAVPSTANNPEDYYAVPPSKHVTVRDCDISFAVSDSMIAGIYIRPGTKDNPIEYISIADNELRVEATNNSGSAAQALLVQRYAPTLSITGNGLESKNLLRTPDTPTWPAGGLFMQVDPDISADVTPLISGNTINGYPTYDFYINITSRGDRVGVPELLTNGFATPGSTWMTADFTDTGSGKSFHKKLIETLLPQIRPGAGYGFLALWFGGTLGAPANTDNVFEAYHRKNNRLYAIDFWGYTIDDTIDNGVYNVSGTGGVNERRARLLLNDTPKVYEKGTFQWTSEKAGTNINVPVP
jgi:hypothetical protein